MLRPAAAGEPAQRSEPAAVGHSAAELAAFAGEYHSVEAETSLVFRVHEGRLIAHRRPARQFPLTPVSRDVFESELGRITFRRAADGAITQLSLRQSRVWDLAFERVR